jgi:hypothetical protein
MKRGDIYKHYKGHTYVVDNIAKHSETLEDMVVYHQFGIDDYWVRPKTMFEENLPDGNPRFKKL